MELSSLANNSFLYHFCITIYALLLFFKFLPSLFLRILSLLSKCNFLFFSFSACYSSFIYISDRFSLILSLLSNHNHDLLYWSFTTFSTHSFLNLFLFHQTFFFLSNLFQLHSAYFGVFLTSPTLISIWQSRGKHAFIQPLLLLLTNTHFS